MSVNGEVVEIDCFVMGRLSLTRPKTFNGKTPCFFCPEFVLLCNVFFLNLYSVECCCIVTVVQCVINLIQARLFCTSCGQGAQGAPF